MGWLSDLNSLLDEALSFLVGLLPSLSIDFFIVGIVFRVVAHVSP